MGKINPNYSIMSPQRIFQNVSELSISGNNYHSMFLSILKDLSIG